MDNTRLPTGRVPILPLVSVVTPELQPISASAAAVVASAIGASDAAGIPYEAAVNPLQFTALQVAGYVNAYATQKQWRCLDVYLDLSQFQVQSPNVGIGFVTCAIYAVTKGMRTLVATGRTRSLALPGAIRIASVRLAIAERLEVVVGSDYNAQQVTPTPNFPAPSITVAVIATDNANAYADDESFGIIGMSNQTYNQFANGGMPMYAGGPFNAILSTIPLACIGVDAVCTVASPRFLQLYPVNSPGAVGTTPPAACWGLPAIGSTIFGTESKIFGALLRSTAWIAAISTSAVQYTAAATGDVVFQAWFR